MSKKILNVAKICIISVFVISVFVFSMINWKNVKGEWIGFWGSIIGSILGGIVTLVALKKTIKSETIARNEDRRLQVIPYFQYNISQDKPKSKLWRDIILDLNLNEKIVDEVIKTDVTYKPDLFFYIDIENVGMNSAVNLSILEIKYCGITDYSYIDYKIMKVGEKIHLSFRVLVDYEDKISINREYDGFQPIKIKLAYTDLLENYYEQDITVHCNFNHNFSIDKEKCIKTIDYISHGINDISSPKYIKGKNIMSERDNKIKKFFGEKSRIKTIISKIKNIKKK